MKSLPLSRRNFIKSGVATSTALTLATQLPSFAGAAETAQKTAPMKPLSAHRNLFNGDCNFLFYNPELWQPEGGAYSARAVHRFIDLLATSGVDTLLVNPNTQVVWYPSKQLEYVLQGYRRGDRSFAQPIAAGNAGLSPIQVEQTVDHLVRLFDLYLDLTEAGVDWLAECSRACRARGISPWLSYRMNATHFSNAPESPASCQLFRDPKNRLSGRIPGAAATTHAGWIGLNYGRRPVRDYMLAMIREGIESYDYEGLELDWLRHPVCLEAPATARQTDEMTDWFAEIKALTKARRPSFPLGLRIPSNLGYLRTIGLDVKTLVQRGIVDFVTFSNFWQTSWEMPHDELRRELGPDVTIYGGMEDAPNWLETHAPSLTERPTGPEIQLAGDNAFKSSQTSAVAKRIRGTRYLTSSPELMRANAAGKLVLGADGLEQFNFFVTDQVLVPGQRADYAALRQLADLNFLRGQEKHYALNTASVQPTKIWDVAEQLPVKIAAQHRRALRLPMCTEPLGTGLTLVIQVITKRTHTPLDCGVSLNGAWPVFVRHESENLLFPAGPYAKHVEEHIAWNYPGDLTALKDGWNEITLYNESNEALDIVGLEIGIVRHKTS
jgi:hypothetical protein